MLFPIGIPNLAVTSTQKMLDAVTHLIAAIDREQVVRFPEAFVKDLRKAHETLLVTIGKVTNETQESQQATQAVLKARATWDDTYRSLKDVATAHLRREGRLDRMNVLFSGLPQPASNASDSAEAQETPPSAAQ